MSNSINHKTSADIPALKQTLGWAWVQLYLFIYSWPLMLVLGFVSLISSDFLVKQNPAIQSIILFSFIPISLYLLKILPRYFNNHIPQRNQVIKKLEQRHRLPHHPLQLQEDRATTVGHGKIVRIAHHIFSLHQRRMLHYLDSLRPIWLRFNQVMILLLNLVLILIFSTIMFSQKNNIQANITENITAPLRLKDVFTQPLLISGWINQPGYSGKEQVLINQDTIAASKETPLEVIEGSQLKLFFARISEQAILETPSRQKIVATNDQQNRGYLSYVLTTNDSGLLRIKQNNSIAESLHLSIIDDSPPKIITAKFQLPQSGATNFGLIIDATFMDDFKNISAQIIFTSPAIYTSSSANHVPFYQQRLNLKPISEEGVSLSQTRITALSRHPLSGTEVEATVEVTDAIEQTSTKTLPLTLPIRAFESRFAQQIITLRKKYYLALKNNQELIITLKEINTQISRNSNINITINQLINKAIISLETNQDQQKVKILAQLWQIALLLENGVLGQALLDLEDSKADLEKALSNPENIDAEVLAEKIRVYQQAWAQYLEYLEKDNSSTDNQGLEPDFLADIFPEYRDYTDRQRIDDRLKTIEQLLQSGLTNRQDWAQGLKNLEDLDTLYEKSQAIEKISENNTLLEFQKQWQKIRRLTNAQQQLFQQTFAQEQNNQSAPLDNLIKQQDNHTQQARQLTQRLDEIQLPQTSKLMDAIANKMALAREEIIQKKLSPAVKNQAHAVQQLVNSQDQFRQGVRNNIYQQSNNLSFAVPPQFNRNSSAAGSNSVNPNGQSTSSGIQGDDGKVSGRAGDSHRPINIIRALNESQTESKKIRKLLNDLRAKASEDRLTPLERRYYEKLLKSFEKF